MVEALRGVDFTLGAGEMVAIMGPSGSGKSTLMHLLGLLHRPDEPNGRGADGRMGADRRTGAAGRGRPEIKRGSEGRPHIDFDGRDVASLSDSERTRLRATEMGFVFQDFNLVPTLTALENVYLAADYAGRGGRSGRQAAAESLAAVGLADRAGHKPAELSGGEQQRVAIARALVNRPKLVLADEPTGNLDSERAAEIMTLLISLNRQHGQTFVLVTHEPEIGDACGRVVRMRDGRIVEAEGAPR